MRILPLVFFMACVVCEISARAQDEEPRAHRPLPKRGLLAKGKTTTTTTPAPQEEEAEYEEYADGEEAQEVSTEAPPSSTEGKKLVAGGVRPFRSNTDLLEALKRRRAQAAEAKLHGPSTTSAAPTHEQPAEPAPSKSSYKKSWPGRKLSTAPSASPNTQQYSAKPSRRHPLNSVFKETNEKKREPIEIIEPMPKKRRTASKNERQRQPSTVYDTPETTPYPRKGQRNELIGKKRFNNSPKESNNEETAALAKPNRNRFSRPSSRAVLEEPEEQNESAPAPARTGRTFRRN